MAAAAAAGPTCRVNSSTPSSPASPSQRFPAVCTAWQSAAAAPASGASPLSPWLMLPFNPTFWRQSGDAAKLLDARFLSLAEGRPYAIRQPSPAIPDRICIGSSPDGWLVTADASSDLHLLDPVTGAQVPLPPATTLPLVDDAVRDAAGRVVSYGLRCCCEALLPPETMAPDMLQYEVYEKAVLVSPPRRMAKSGDWGGYAVVLICNPLSRLVVARAGDMEWAPLDDTRGRRCWVDAGPAVAAGAAGGGQSQSQSQVVYTMDTEGRVDAWDVRTSPTDTTSSSRAVAPPCRCSAHACAAMTAVCRKYLVELTPGHLLQVYRIRDAAHTRYAWEPRPDHVEYTTGVELFEWTTAGANSSVLRGRALFLGKNASVCVPVDGGGGGWPEPRGKCVYFTDDGPWSNERCHKVAPDVGVLDLIDGSYRPPRGAARELLWKRSPPVWVFSSLAT